MCFCKHRHNLQKIDYLPNFVTHVSQEFTLTSVRQFSSLSGSSVLLDTVAQIEHLRALREHVAQCMRE